MIVVTQKTNGITNINLSHASKDEIRDEVKALTGYWIVTWFRSLNQVQQIAKIKLLRKLNHTTVTI